MPHVEATYALLKLEKIESRIVTIKGVTNSKIISLL